jgi:translocator protein
VTRLKPVRKRSIATAIAIALLTIALGQLFTDLGPWYRALKIPAWQPPGPAFGIIWSIIYTLATISGVLVWRTVHNRSDGGRLFAVFGANIGLNLLWSYIFFIVKRPDWALSMVWIFWLSILALILFIWPKHKLASVLLAPYLVWVGIASYLNLAVVQLNAPFG